RLLDRGSEYGRCPLQDLDVLAEPAVFASQLRQFPQVRAAQSATIADLGIRSGLVGPRVDRRLSQVSVLRRGAARSAVALPQLDDLGPQLADGPVPTPVAVPRAGAPPTRRPGGDVAGRLREDVCRGYGSGPLVIHPPGGRQPALPLRPAQLQ